MDKRKAATFIQFLLYLLLTGLVIAATQMTGSKNLAFTVPVIYLFFFILASAEILSVTHTKFSIKSSKEYRQKTLRADMIIVAYMFLCAILVDTDYRTFHFAVYPLGILYIVEIYRISSRYVKSLHPYRPMYYYAVHRADDFIFGLFRHNKKRI